MSLGYLDFGMLGRGPCCDDPCNGNVNLSPACPSVPGVFSKTIVVLNETMLLALTDGEIVIGDDVIIVLPTSRTSAYGVVKYVYPDGVGWNKFTLLGVNSYNPASNDIYAPQITQETGGTSDALDSVPTSALGLLTLLRCVIGGQYRAYQLQPNGDGIRGPDYNPTTNNKSWTEVG